MKKIALALAASIASTPAMAGPYVNVETNADYTGSDYTSRATDLHIGYENELGSLAYYVQGGKTINAADGVDSESNFSGKLGASVSATDKLGLYGEVSFAQVEDADNTYGTKLGAKYSF
ncbi:hypothetical protein PRUG_00039 [Prochlorococcus phage P-SSP6]|uniref:Cyanophage outer membrane protein-like beta-barrel domain-containing protein n=3 Tax=Tangaroavirus TaxID=2731981 RepID=M1NXH7_9CAUD|nr:gp222 [Cyanophage 9515-10a]YP_005087545.1 gp222 [Cyanophage NATL2A-133]ADP00063.1 gp222 [Cyanophage 9515-10a]ADP00173.1 gp222 [Cyanophage NATL2A-133]AGF91596.1 hypothetical protein PRUG_00039 [Prochlorococcus phage P-SSP6]